MTPLQTVTSLGLLCCPGGWIVIERLGCWVASWVYPGRGGAYASASATSPDAALEALAEEMCSGAARQAIAELETGSTQGREVAEAIRLTLQETGADTGELEDAMLSQRLISAGRSEPVGEQMVEDAIEHARRRVW